MFGLEERSLPFDRVAEMDWQQAVVVEDTRKDYGERRFRAFGMIGERLFAVVFTPRADVMHIISFRKANKREVKQYD
ncbi:MAG: BrnT family toxin [Methylobacter sp.]|nr:BrnT family toxin [Methylobacter sp.]